LVKLDIAMSCWAFIGIQIRVFRPLLAIRILDIVSLFINSLQA